MQNPTLGAKLQRKRPKYLNLLEIRQPLPAVVSILHRVSGRCCSFPAFPSSFAGLEGILEFAAGIRSDFNLFLAASCIKDRADR